MPTRRFALVAALVVALGLAAAIALAQGGGQREALTIYSGRTENLVGPLLERFHDETGVPIDVKYGDSAELALLIDAEGARTPADVFYSQSPGATGFLAGQERLAPLPAEVLARVDPRFRNRAGGWVGVTGRQRVLVYNRDLVSETQLPASVLDLTDPRYAGKVALAPDNGSFQDFVTAMRQLHGDDAAARWLRAMADNDSPTYPNNNAIVEAVGRGEVPMGLANHYYNHRFLQEDPARPSRNHVFSGGDIGALVIPSPVSVVAGTDQPEAARRFVEYLLSADAQRYFAAETFEYPLAAGVAPAADLPALETLQVPAYDFDDLGGGLPRAGRCPRRR
ncbi:MAG: iron ABC transporter substrate-binding protein [Actinomycetota bacterium]|nr:iron ABC transporter substrate-binding protein [Actinomycetota bacterium]